MSQHGHGQDLPLPRCSGGVKTIVIAPLSNSALRNWPRPRYTRLIGLLLAELDCQVLLVGSASQAAALHAMSAELGHDPRVVSLAGRVDWAGLAAIVARADLVVANNSGVAHLAAACGAPTLAIYSGSHQPQEWGPRGGKVKTLMAAVPCTPCGHDKLEACPYDHRCMTLIEPQTVLQAALEMLGQSAQPAAAGAASAG
jgi:ADP-heptose:LPS heptosyltransferase